MGKKKETGRKRDFYGHQVLTSELAPGCWHVLVYVKRPGDTIEKDGFEFEGLALDWAEDWAHQHRSITYKLKNVEDGTRALILDHNGREIQQLAAQPAPHAAELLAQKYIEALRLHDLELIEERRKVRANFRMELEELDERDAYFDKQIADAKDAKKKLEEKRTDLKTALHSPQREFNFVASTAHDDREQLDLEDDALRRRDPRAPLRSVKGGGGNDQPGANNP